jgi:hypothetical protein
MVAIVTIPPTGCRFPHHLTAERRGRMVEKLTTDTVKLFAVSAIQQRNTPKGLATRLVNGWRVAKTTAEARGSFFEALKEMADYPDYTIVDIGVSEIPIEEVYGTYKESLT